MVSSHNGGLTNIYPFDPSLDVVETIYPSLANWYTDLSPFYDDQPPLMLNDYEYWHWGPDEALKATNIPPGYTDALEYSFVSISNSFVDLAGWGLTGGSSIRSWAAPGFNANHETSKQVIEELGIKTSGEEKLGPFPHWTLSTETPDKTYPFVSIGVSELYIGADLAQSMENGHTVASVDALVDFYYSMGGLINLYSHASSAGNAQLPTQPQEYVNYSLNATLHPRLWATNAEGIYYWWVARSNAHISSDFTTNGNQSIAIISITGATDPNTAVEILVPSAAYAGLQVYTNGIQTDTNYYRVNGQLVRILVGNTVTNAEISYTLSPTASDDYYVTRGGTTLTVTAPGVLSNDEAGSGGSLTAEEISGPTGGTLVLNSDGSFVYTPTNGFLGMDSFTYQAGNGVTNSNPATVLIMVLPPDAFLYDDFTRPATYTNSLWPWIVEDGLWSLTGGVLTGQDTPVPTTGYDHAYINNTNWTDYTVQARIKFDSTNDWGGGISGRLDPSTGARYAAWVYPEGSGGGSSVLKLFKFEGWSTLSGTPMVQVSLPGVGTDWHTLAMSFQGTNISVYYDGIQVISTADANFDAVGPFLSGGITAELGTVGTVYTLTFDDVIVSALPIVAGNDSYSTIEDTTLTVTAPGVLGNDSGGAGSLTAVLVSGTANGNLNLNADGSFTYTPTNNFLGTDSFTYEASDGQTNSNIATVTITVTIASFVANDDGYSVGQGTTLTVPAPGVFTNDVSTGTGWTATLVDGTADGTLNLNADGSFNYTPTNNFVGDGWLHLSSG